LKLLQNWDVDWLAHSAYFGVSSQDLKVQLTDSIEVVGCGAALLVLAAKREWVEL